MAHAVTQTQSSQVNSHVPTLVLKLSTKEISFHKLIEDLHARRLIGKEWMKAFKQLPSAVAERREGIAYLLRDLLFSVLRMNINRDTNKWIDTFEKISLSIEEGSKVASMHLACLLVDEIGPARLRDPGNYQEQSRLLDCEDLIKEMLKWTLSEGQDVEAFIAFAEEASQRESLCDARYKSAKVALAQQSRESCALANQVGEKTYNAFTGLKDKAKGLQAERRSAVSGLHTRMNTVAAGRQEVAEELKDLGRKVKDGVQRAAEDHATLMQVRFNGLEVAALVKKL